MSRAVEEINRSMLRVRDAIDGRYRDELDLVALAENAHVTPAHLVRSFRRVFGETPHRYLQRRRVERAMYLLRSTDLPVTRICTEVGFASPGTFGRTFSDVVGESPTAHRARGPMPPVPSCFTMAWSRPAHPRRSPPDAEAGQDADFGEARGSGAAPASRA
jgi:AraC-like DNA-binding protein